jgi:hypothetical protein
MTKLNHRRLLVALIVVCGPSLPYLLGIGYLVWDIILGHHSIIESAKILTFMKNKTSLPPFQ